MLTMTDDEIRDAYDCAFWDANAVARRATAWSNPAQSIEFKRLAALAAEMRQRGFPTI